MISNNRYTNTISVTYSFKQVLEIIRKAVVTLFIRVNVFRVTQYPWEKSLAVLKLDFHVSSRLWLSPHEYCYSSSAETLTEIIRLDMGRTILHFDYSIPYLRELGYEVRTTSLL